MKLLEQIARKAFQLQLKLAGLTTVRKEGVAEKRPECVGGINTPLPEGIAAMTAAIKMVPLVRNTLVVYVKS